MQPRSLHHQDLGRTPAGTFFVTQWTPKVTPFRQPERCSVCEGTHSAKLFPSQGSRDILVATRIESDQVSRLLCNFNWSEASEIMWCLT